MNLETFLDDAIRRAVREELHQHVAELKRVVQIQPTQQLDLLLVEDIARTCKAEPAAVRGWIKSGKLIASKPGRHYLVRRVDFEAFLSKQAEVDRPVTEDEAVDNALDRIAHIGRRRG